MLLKPTAKVPKFFDPEKAAMASQAQQMNALSEQQVMAASSAPAFMIHPFFLSFFFFF